MHVNDQCRIVFGGRSDLHMHTTQNNVVVRPWAYAKFRDYLVSNVFMWNKPSFDPVSRDNFSPWQLVSCKQVLMPIIRTSRKPVVLQYRNCSQFCRNAYYYTFAFKANSDKHCTIKAFTQAGSIALSVSTNIIYEYLGIQTTVQHLVL